MPPTIDQRADAYAVGEVHRLQGLALEGELTSDMLRGVLASAFRIGYAAGVADGAVARGGRMPGPRCKADGCACSCHRGRHG